MLFEKFASSEQIKHQSYIKERDYPAAFLSADSASIDGAKEEDSGSDALHRQFELSRRNLELLPW